jgi:hypothetical protein
MQLSDGDELSILPVPQSSGYNSPFLYWPEEQWL